ncbi:unnamed protein product [Caenorhabditis brenneri]
MPHQPFFVPYSSQVCPVDVQTVEEPSEESQIPLFLHLFVALVFSVLFIGLVVFFFLLHRLVVFLSAIRIARHSQISFIIGFLVLLFVGVVFASDASATSTTSTTSSTYENVKEWVWRFKQEHKWLVDLTLIGAMAYGIYVAYTCLDYRWRLKPLMDAMRVDQNPNNNTNNNNDNVAPYVNVGYEAGTDEVHFNVGDPHRDNQNPNQHL